MGRRQARHCHPRQGPLGRDLPRLRRPRQQGDHALHRTRRARIHVRWEPPGMRRGHDRPGRPRR